MKVVACVCVFKSNSQESEYSFVREVQESATRLTVDQNIDIYLDLKDNKDSAALNRIKPFHFIL